MLCRILSLLVAGVLAYGTLGSSAVSAAEQGSDSWRYRYWNNQWWYWVPEGHWAYWQNKQWNNYRPSTGSLASRAAGDTNTGSGRVQVPCVLCGYSETSGQSSDVADVGTGRSSAYPESSRIYQVSAGPSKIGPLYGKALSSTTPPHAFSTNAEPGPFYDHAGSSFDLQVDRSHFLGY
jgi:hypothetical protein